MMDHAESEGSVTLRSEKQSSHQPIPQTLKPQLLAALSGVLPLRAPTR